MIMIGPIVCSIRSIIGEIRLSSSIFGEEQQRTNPFSLSLSLEAVSKDERWAMD